MRVALDLTAAPERIVGAGVYMVNLARALNRLPVAAGTVVFAAPALLEQLQVSNGSIECVPVQHRGRASRLLWEQVWLPRLLSQHLVDVLHSPHYTAPLLSSVRSVVTFHDMTFLL